jgi:hypothetical protein
MTATQSQVKTASTIQSAKKKLESLVNIALGKLVM